MSDTDEITEGPLPARIVAATSPVAMLGKARIRPGKVAEFEDLIRSILPKIRREDGCIHYTVNRSHDDDSAFVLYEEWESGAAILAHLQQPFMADYFGKVPGFMAPGAELPGWSSPL
ncbi:MAG: putative quinol monooxygenase [Actinoplanes sp.]